MDAICRALAPHADSLTLLVLAALLRLAALAN